MSIYKMYSKKRRIEVLEFFYYILLLSICIYIYIDAQRKTLLVNVSTCVFISIASQIRKNVHITKNTIDVLFKTSSETYVVQGVNEAYSF